MRVGNTPYTVATVVIYRATQGPRRWIEYTLVDHSGKSRTVEYDKDTTTWEIHQEVRDGAKRARLEAGKAVYQGKRFPHDDDYIVIPETALGEFKDAPVPGEPLSFRYFSGDECDLFARFDRAGRPIEWYRADETDKPIPISSKSSKSVVPEPRHIGWSMLRWATAYGIVALGIHLGFRTLGSNELVYQSMDRDLETSASWTSEPFELRGRTSNVLAQVSSNAFNKSLGLELTLVDTESQKRYRRYEEIGQYSGYEHGERWTEGSADIDMYFSSIPSGTYVLRAHAQGDGTGLQYRIQMYRDVANSRYLLYVLMGLAAIPLLYGLNRLSD